MSDIKQGEKNQIFLDRMVEPICSKNGQEMLILLVQSLLLGSQTSLGLFDEVNLAQVPSLLWNEGLELEY
jgi:hypothetical protein